LSQPVDYSNQAITLRIQQLSQASRLIQPFAPSVDMSGEAIGRRLREVAALRSLGASLAAAGAQALAPAVAKPPVAD